MIEAMLMSSRRRLDVPEVVGTPFEGGYFVCVMYEADLQTEYALVVSLKEEGAYPARLSWPEAFNFAQNLDSGGFTDWKLPDIDEMYALYWNLKPSTDSNTLNEGASDRIIPSTSNYTSNNPSQTTLTAFQAGNSEAFSWSSSSGGATWTEVERDSSSAYLFYFHNGRILYGSKSTSATPRNGRAVRRVYLY